MKYRLMELDVILNSRFTFQSFDIQNVIKKTEKKHIERK